MCYKNEYEWEGHSSMSLYRSFDYHTIGIPGISPVG